MTQRDIEINLKLKNTVKISASKNAKKWTTALRIFTAIVLAIPLICVFSIFGFSQLSQVANIITIVIFFLGILIGTLTRVWVTLEVKLTNRFYTSMINEFGLDKY